MHIKQNECYVEVYECHVKNGQEMNNLRITQLYSAASEGNFDICKLIIDHLDDKNPGNIVGSTPLHKAAKRGHLQVVKS